MAVDLERLESAAMDLGDTVEADAVREAVAEIRAAREAADRPVIPARDRRIEELELELGAMRSERDEARGMVQSLASRRPTLSCAFCGEQYPEGTPAHGSETLSSHIRKCPKHPMSRLTATLEKFERRIASLRVDRVHVRITLARAIAALEAYEAQVKSSGVESYIVNLGDLIRDVRNAHMACGDSAAFLGEDHPSRPVYVESINIPHFGPATVRLTDGKEYRTSSSASGLTEGLRAD